MGYKDVEAIARRMDAAAQKLTKWRSVFAGWQLGTRADTDGESKAVRDHREVTMLLRAEVNGLTGLLLDKGICTEVELTERMADEFEHLDKQYEEKFDGFNTTPDGVQMDVQRARATMKRLGFPA